MSVVIKLDKFNREREGTKVDIFTRAYITCALWTTPSQIPADGGLPLGYVYTTDDIADETLVQIVDDCTGFQAANWRDIMGDLERAGRDFWLSRNGLAGGFIESDWPGNVADRLTVLAAAAGNVELLVDKDGLIHSRYSSACALSGGSGGGTEEGDGETGTSEAAGEADGEEL